MSFSGCLERARFHLNAATNRRPFFSEPSPPKSVYQDSICCGRCGFVTSSVFLAIIRLKGLFNGYHSGMHILR